MRALVEPGADRRLRFGTLEFGRLGGERLEVGAGTERFRPLAGEHEGVGLVVGLEVVKAAQQKVGGLVVDRVASVRTGDLENRGGADALV